MRYLGIDIGSSFIKGAVLDTDAMRLSHIERVEAPPLVSGLDPMFREINPEAFAQCVRGVLERLHDHAPDAAGVLMCSQLHGMVLCDEEGCALTRFITWQDQRALKPQPDSGESCFDEIERIISREERLELGNERVPGVPLNYLFWFARQRAFRRGHALRPACAFTRFHRTHSIGTRGDLGSARQSSTSKLKWPDSLDWMF
jgi:sugar (pentulose or hexulose) kinase